MKQSTRKILKFALEMAIAALSAAAAALGTTSCMSAVGVL
jgi:hypothetical protein